MNRQQLRETLIAELSNIAPDIDAASVEDHVHLRDTYELDSMDALNLLAAIHQRLGIVIPEAEYAHMHRLADMLDYLEQASAQQ